MSIELARAVGLFFTNFSEKGGRGEGERDWLQELREEGYKMGLVSYVMPSEGEREGREDVEMGEEGKGKRGEEEEEDCSGIYDKQPFFNGSQIVRGYGVKPGPQVIYLLRYF